MTSETNQNGFFKGKESHITLCELSLFRILKSAITALNLISSVLVCSLVIFFKLWKNACLCVVFMQIIVLPEDNFFVPDFYS